MYVSVCAASGVAVVTANRLFLPSLGREEKEAESVGVRMKKIEIDSMVARPIRIANRQLQMCKSQKRERKR